MGRRGAEAAEGLVGGSWAPRKKVGVCWSSGGLEVSPTIRELRQISLF